MTITAEQQACLDTLELKENSELYNLAITLFNSPTSNRGNTVELRDQRKKAWDATIEAFCKLAMRPQPGAAYTPLTLFLKIAHLIKNPNSLLKDIMELAETMEEAELFPFDLGIYDGNTAIVLVEQATADISFPYDTIYSLLSEDRRHVNKMFAPLARLDNNRFRTLLQKLSTCAIDKEYKYHMIYALLTCQPDTDINALPSPTNFCELAIQYANTRLLKLFIPRTSPTLRFEALHFAINHGRDEDISILLNTDPNKTLAQKIICEGQELLKLYLNISSEPNLEIMTSLLNSACQYDDRIGQHFNESKSLSETGKFFSNIEFNTVPIAKLTENLHHLNLHYNARDSQGNTVFYLLFDRIMQVSPSSFTALLMIYLGNSITPNSIILSLPNKKGETIHTLPYLDTHQRNCLLIAEIIKEAQNQYLKIDSQALTTKEREECIADLNKKLTDISCKVDNLASNDLNIFVLSLRILHIYLNSDNNAMDFWIKRIEAFIALQTEPDSFIILNNCIHYIFSADNQNFSPKVSAIYNNIVQKILGHIKQHPKRLSVSDLIAHQIDNPFKTLCNYSEKNILPIVKVCLEHDLSPDVIIDTHNNSLLHKLFSYKVKTEEWKQVMDLIFKALTCYRSTLTLALANERGNTPLHEALINNLSNPYVSKLVNVMLNQQHNLNNLNKDGFTPFYCAITWEFLGIANHILNHTTTPVQLKAQLLVQNPTPTPGGPTTIYKTVTALTLLARNFSSIVIRLPLSTEVLVSYRNNVILSLQFAIKLLEKGCHYFPKTQPIDAQEFTIFFNHLNSYSTGCTALWDKDNPNPFPDFIMRLNNLSSAWKIIEDIESGKVVAYGALYPFLSLVNTRRFSDDKSMFEILISTHNKLKTELSTVENENQKTELEHKILNLNEIISCVLLKGIQHPEMMSDENHLTCARLATKIRMLKHNKQWLEAPNWPKPETKKQSEVVIRDETTLSTLTEEIFEDLKQSSLFSSREYVLFEALCYFECAECLFRMDTKLNRLQISPKVLLLSNKYLQEALSLSRHFSNENIIFREPMVKLNAVLAPCVPDPNGMHKLKALLEALIPHDTEAAIRQQDTCAFPQVNDLLHVYGGGKFTRSNSNFTHHDPSICTAIPEALERGNKRIEALEEELETIKAEALAKEQLLLAKIAKLEQERTLAIQAPVSKAKKRLESMADKENISAEQWSKKRLRKTS